MTKFIMAVFNSETTKYKAIVRPTMKLNTTEIQA